MQPSLVEAVSKLGFWFKVAAGPSLKPQAYSSISRILNEAPTKTLGQKTILKQLLIHFGVCGTGSAANVLSGLPAIFNLYATIA